MADLDSGKSDERSSEFPKTPSSLATCSIALFLGYRIWLPRAPNGRSRNICKAALNVRALWLMIKAVLVLCPAGLSYKVVVDRRPSQGALPDLTVCWAYHMFHAWGKALAPDMDRKCVPEKVLYVRNPSRPGSIVPPAS
ncbi:hypothetical protein BJ166DRAFT_527400 [Pestalotiopsis sp. NC0098]|nr:hypothetical protein BJ166DRAFT_527400 [Pestalotiopsis sp. NC0098]